MAGRLIRCVLAGSFWWISGAAASDAVPLDGDDFAHGLEQVERLLADRPVLNDILVDGDPLRTWAAARFAGSGSRARIFWDPTPPPEGIDAQSRFEPEPVVRVHPVFQDGPHAGRGKPASDLWADLVFELHNMAQMDRVGEAWLRVVKGELGYAGWLQAVTAAEHRALLFTQAFHRTRWRPWMRQRGLPASSYRWRQINAVPVQYENWIASYDDPGGYPWEDYSVAYREVLAELRPAGEDWSINPFALHDLKPSR
ncbi:MAG: hypothetical protein R3200_08725 [Xanthomonadales bacterium]|nr:hypothetical protein [Xanthomonadales bacterium]